jgi:hypothetical protein
VIFLARVLTGGGNKLPARVLPKLAFAVPMETKLRQGGGDVARRLLVKLNPNPLSNHFGHLPKAGGFIIKQVANSCGGESAIVKSLPKINPMQLFRIAVF